jgi:hypothetical protein
MIEDRSLSVKRACEQTGVPRRLFYKALKSELVQAEMADWLALMRTVEAKLLKDNWSASLASMASSTPTLHNRRIPLRSRLA